MQAILLLRKKKGIWELSGEGKQKAKQLEESDDSILEEFRIEVHNREKAESKALRKRRAKENKLIRPNEEQDISDSVLARDDEITAQDMQGELKRKHLSYIQTEIAPDKFEKLCGELLRRAGYKDVEITKQTGDGGIDGFGYFPSGLTKMKVIFQAKRYKDTKIAPNPIRELGGVKRKHPDAKALFITSSSFSREAVKEAQEFDIELIDGDKLIDLLYEYELGYSKSDIYTMNEKFFKEEL